MLKPTLSLTKRMGKQIISLKKKNLSSQNQTPAHPHSAVPRHGDISVSVNNNRITITSIWTISPKHNGRCQNLRRQIASIVQYRISVASVNDPGVRTFCENWELIQPPDADDRWAEAASAAGPRRRSRLHFFFFNCWLIGFSLMWWFVPYLSTNSASQRFTVSSNHKHDYKD